MKLFRIDYLINTILVFSVMLAMPILSEFEFFKPFFVHFKNFELTDINYKEIGGKEMSDSTIILIKSNGLDLNQLGALIYKLNNEDSKPKVIGIETILKDKSDSVNIEFINSLKNYDNIVIADSLLNFNEDNNQFQSIIKYSGIDSTSILSGYKNLLIGQDKEFYTVREYFPFFVFNGNRIESFSAQVAKKYNPDSFEILKSRNNIYETINYKGGEFTQLDFKSIMNNDHKVNFKDKIVLIGFFDRENENTPCVVADLFFTPMNDNNTGKAFPDMYGVEIQANIISMILDKEYFTLIPSLINYLIAAFFVYMNMVVFTYITLKNKDLYELMNLIIFVVESLFVFYLSGLLYFQYRIEIDFTPAIFALILSIFAFEGYNESFKPLAIKFYYKFLKKGDL